MPRSLPPLYAITDRTLASGRTHEEIVRALVVGGARWIQVREKDLSDRETLEQTRACVAIGASSKTRVILNDRADLAIMAGAAGVHLGGEDLPAVEARRLMGPEAMIGVSTHSVEEAIEAARLPVDYVALGPIHLTSHASVRRDPLGLEAVARAASSIEKPLVVIGGIDLDRAPELIHAGAASVAVMGDLMTATNITSRTTEYFRALT